MTDLRFVQAEHEGIIQACKIGGGESRLNWNDYRKMHFTQHVCPQALLNLALNTSHKVSLMYCIGLLY